MPDVSIQASRRDMDRLARQMDRARNELGVSVGQSVKMATISVLRSCAASTRVAPKRRKGEVLEVMQTRKLKSGKEGKPRKVRVYGFTAYRKGKSEFQPVFGAKNKTEAGKDPRATIRMRGLAKSSWIRLAAKAGLRVNGETVATSHAKGKAWKQTFMEYSFKGKDPYAKITNRIPYIMQALEGGQAALNSAIRRGAKSMEKIISHRLQKAGAK